MMWMTGFLFTVRKPMIDLVALNMCLKVPDVSDTTDVSGFIQRRHVADADLAKDDCAGRRGRWGLKR